jgi:orotate phosphoribosyltransferase
MGKSIEQVLAMKDLGSLRRLSTFDFEDRESITESEVSHILRACDALWIHSGDSKAPHAVTTKGKCTDGFVDVLRALRYTNICELLAHQMVKRIETEIDQLGITSPSWVIGSDHAGAAFSHAVATWMWAMHDFTEKGGHEGKQQLWKRFTVQPGETVLQVEELVTTTSTLRAVREGIRNGNACGPVQFLSFVATLIHRSTTYDFVDDPILYLVHYDINTWEPGECPLCAQGSKRIVEPKKYWGELTGTP